jgi:hypothetical protein
MRARMESGDHYLTIPMMGMFVPRFGQGIARRFARRVASLSSAAVGVTNLGRIDMPARYGPLAVERLHVAVGVSVVGHLSLSASSFGGSLALNFVYIEPQLDRATIERIAARVLADLQALVDTPHPLAATEPRRLGPARAN